MSGNFPVRHERGFNLKWNQVQKGFRRGNLTWADEAHTLIRDCTADEQIKFQVKLAEARERLAYAEVPGCSFKHPGADQERRLAWEGTAFPVRKRIFEYLSQVDQTAAAFFEDVIDYRFAAGAAA